MMKTKIDPDLDDHGQPLNRMYGRKRLNDRTIDELIGLSRGIIADEVVNQKESEFLRYWMKVNIPYCEDPLVNQLYCRISDMLIDGILDEYERKELMGILAEFTGETTVGTPANLSSSLPLCDPPPKVVFKGKLFCLTGKFAYGPRRICEAVVVERGGRLAKQPTLDLNYLVIGTFSSSAWIHTSYGRKIEKAAEYRETSKKLSIISENHWAEWAFNR